MCVLPSSVGLLLVGYILPFVGSVRLQFPFSLPPPPFSILDRCVLAGCCTRSGCHRSPRVAAPPRRAARARASFQHARSRDTTPRRGCLPLRAPRPRVPVAAPRAPHAAVQFLCLCCRVWLVRSAVTFYILLMRACRPTTPHTRSVDHVRSARVRFAVARSTHVAARTFAPYICTFYVRFAPPAPLPRPAPRCHHAHVPRSLHALLPRSVAHARVLRLPHAAACLLLLLLPFVLVTVFLP